MSTDPWVDRRDAWKEAEGRADQLARLVCDELLAPRAWRSPSSVVRVKDLLRKYDAAAQAERAAWGEFQALELGASL